MPSFLSKTFSFSLGKINISPSYLQAGAIILLLFLLVLAIAQFRRHLFEYSLKGSLFGLFLGFLLVLILEGFLIIGGRTAVTEILGWQNPPKPILTALDAGKEKLIDVLGMTDEIPASLAKEKPTWEEVIDVFQKLDPAQVKKAKTIICEP